MKKFICLFIFSVPLFTENIHAQSFESITDATIVDYSVQNQGLICLLNEDGYLFLSSFFGLNEEQSIPLSIDAKAIEEVGDDIYVVSSDSAYPLAPSDVLSILPPVSMEEFNHNRSVEESMSLIHTHELSSTEPIHMHKISTTSEKSYASTRPTALRQPGIRDGWQNAIPIQTDSSGMVRRFDRKGIYDRQMSRTYNGQFDGWSESRAVADRTENFNVNGAQVNVNLDQGIVMYNGQRRVIERPAIWKGGTDQIKQDPYTGTLVIRCIAAGGYTWYNLDPQTGKIDKIARMSSTWADSDWKVQEDQIYIKKPRKSGTKIYTVSL